MPRRNATLFALAVLLLSSSATPSRSEFARTHTALILRPACAPIKQAETCVPPHLPLGQKQRPRLDYSPRTVDVDAMRQAADERERLRRRNQ